MKNYIGQVINLTGDSYLNPPWSGHSRNVGTITSISIHHNAIQRAKDYDSVALYRNEAASHYQNLGPGLQYHYTIDNVGQIFAIRPHTTWLHAVGSAENTTMLAICLDGNFENQQPTREQFEALYQLLENLCEQHPEFPATWPDVRSHNDYSATACCGANLRGRIFAIQDKASAQAQLLNVGEYDWPQYQSVPTLPPPAPVIPTPAPPSVQISYRVFKDGKQIGAYALEKNAWNKYKAEGGRIMDQNNNDVTDQLIAKYEPVAPPVVPPPEQDHDYAQENNGILKQILAIVTEILNKIKGIF
ncbi:MAG TPA: peptidoglycan recognition family protein, partial [Candidatus Saccharibacteria bacterium]|nr:peptidoglycan recognition family protein [Candidatus Saccharibacteria bacterium]